MPQTYYRVNFWQSADESEAPPLYVIAVPAYSHSEALWEAIKKFLNQGWGGVVDHVTIVSPE